ncbi:MAG: transposase [Bacilli bacterium]|nr:transposase [Bacilli bacterium]
MYKSFKFRVYPNKLQIELLNRSFGCSRFVYNYYLSNIKNNGYNNAYSNIADYVNNLKYEYTFLQEVDSIIIRKTLFHLDDNLKKYYHNGFGYPKYKSKFDKNSYTTSAIYSKYKDKVNCNIELDLINRKIKLPKLKWLDIKGYRNLKNINGKIINATISKERNGKYYVSILYDLIDIKNKEFILRKIVGIDLGIKKLLTLSDGIVVENNKYIEKYEKRIKRIQRELSRKVKRSNNYYKCKKKLAILHSKLKNARNYYLHNITKKITDEYDIITCEKLNIQNMLKEHNLSKKISDASFYEIIRQLEYKSKYKNKLFYQIDTYYPSSQECSICGNIDKKYKNLSEREYKCSNCYHEIDRDLNASINIMWEGLKLYMKNEIKI